MAASDHLGRQFPQQKRKDPTKFYHVTQEEYEPGQVIESTVNSGYAVLKPESMLQNVRGRAASNGTTDKPIHTYEVKPNSYSPWANWMPSGQTRYSDKRGMTIVNKVNTENYNK